jgi:hypothetical protein
VYRTHLLLREVQLVLLRELHHHAERLPPRDDRRLVYRPRALREQRDERVPALVVRGQPPVLFRDDRGLRAVPYTRMSGWS